MQTRSALNRKLLRDAWHLRGQLLAIAAVVFCGVSIFLTMKGMYETLVNERDDYYSQYRFADVFAQLKRAPESLQSRLSQIEGVQAVQTSIALDVTLDVPGLVEPATGRLVSVNGAGQTQLNDLHIIRGRMLELEDTHAVLISEAFALANKLEPGATISALVNGRFVRLMVAGIAIGPEFVYVLRPTTGLPDDQHYAILWMNRQAIQNAFDMGAAFNQVAIKLTADASQGDVITQVDRLLEPYGGLGAYDRSDHSSNKTISDEINQVRIYGFFISAIFLAQAAFILNIVLSRLISTQRDQIGILRAFGFTTAEVGWHFIKLALIPIGLGFVVALPVALWMGSELASIYQDFFHFPRLTWSLGASGVLLAMGICVVAGLAGAWGSLQKAIHLAPAEAMRAEPPKQFRPALMERLGLEQAFSVHLRMIMRNIERRPIKAVFSVVGIALAIAILLLGRYGTDALDRIIDVEFGAAQREDVSLFFSNPMGSDALLDLKNLPGVLQVEPFRSVPVKLRFGHRVHRAVIQGFDQHGQLRAIVDADYRQQPLPAEGVVLSSKLAQSLGVTVGDSLEVEILEGQRSHTSVEVVGLVDDLIGMGAFMLAENLNRLQQEGRLYSGALLRVDASQREPLYQALKRLPQVHSIGVKQSMLDNFERVIAKTLTVQTLINVVFASVIAFGVVYNSARISLSERGHELASLRVLGFTRREIALVLLGEQALLAIWAIPIGFLLGYAMNAAVAAAMNASQEIFRLPLVLSGTSLIFSVSVVAMAFMLSSAIIWARLRRMDLVAALKIRE